MSRETGLTCWKGFHLKSSAFKRPFPTAGSCTDKWMKHGRSYHHICYRLKTINCLKGCMTLRPRGWRLQSRVSCLRLITMRNAHVRFAVLQNRKPALIKTSWMPPVQSLSRRKLRYSISITQTTSSIQKLKGSKGGLPSWRKNVPELMRLSPQPMLRVSLN